MHLIIFGATGRCLVEQTLARGHRVRATARTPALGINGFDVGPNEERRAALARQTEEYEHCLRWLGTCVDPTTTVGSRAVTSYGMKHAAENVDGARYIPEGA